MKFRHILLSSLAFAALTFASCQDDSLSVPGAQAPGVSLSVVTVNTGSISRADKPVREAGDPNENYMHKVHVIITTAPINSGTGTVLKVITRDGITNEQNLDREYGTDGEGNPTDNWTAVNSQETPLYWYDSGGTAHSVYTDSQDFRAYITSKVEFNNDRDLADETEDLIDYVEAQEAANGGTPVYLYATAVANIDLDKFVDAAGAPKTIAAGMTVAELRNLIYVGPLYNTPNDYFPYDPANPDTKFGWGPTGWPGGPVRFTAFAMSAVNEIKFRPEFDASGRYTFPTLVVQRMAARIDIAFGVQAVTDYNDAEINYESSRTKTPYITDRGWFYVGDPVYVNGRATYPNADSNPRDGKTGPDNKKDAPFEGSFGAGYVGLVDITPDPGPGYIARYLYDMDVTGDDQTTGSPFRRIETGRDGNGIERPWKWGSELKYNDASLTVTYGTFHGETYPVWATIDGYDSMTAAQKEAFDKFLKDNLQTSYLIDESTMTDFQTKNYAGQFRFPIYDEEKFLAGEGDVLITGAVFYMQSIRLLNCTNTGVYLYEQADVNGNRRYMHNEGDWQAQGSVSYPSYFIYSTPKERRSFTDRQLTGLENFDHRPVPCIESGLKTPNISRTLFSPTGDKKFGVYSILGYVGENTYSNYSPDNRYTGIQLEGVTNLGHYFTDTEQLETNDGNLRTRVKVSMNLCHSFGGGGSNPRGNNMHFATVRNTVYRVYVKFYAKGESLMVRYWFYDGQDNAFREVEYEKADFYSNILEDDRYRPVVD